MVSVTQDYQPPLSYRGDARSAAIAANFAETGEARLVVRRYVSGFLAPPAQYSPSMGLGSPRL
jgi:hypothetical protein